MKIGSANYVMKWPGSNQQAYIKIVQVKKCNNSYDMEMSGQYSAILALECRGLEPIAWIPSSDFEAETITGKLFPTVDLSEGDWCDFDEDNDMPVSVMGLDYRIEKI